MKTRFIYCLLYFISLFFSCTPEHKNEILQDKTDTLLKEKNNPFTDKAGAEMEEETIRYNNGAIKMQGYYVKGKREGVWRSWYSNGKLWSEGTYKQGVKEGKTVVWYENGQKRYEGNYKNNLQTGEWLFWDETGRLIKSQKY